MKRNDYVSASQAGKTAWCPHAASLIARGVKPDHRHEQRTMRGTASHERLTKAVVASQDQRCFVASYALGPTHPITQQLRDWRDQTLKPWALGRLVIAVYYFASPWIIKGLGKNEAVRRDCARLVTWFAGKVVR